MKRLFYISFFLIPLFLLPSKKFWTNWARNQECYPREIFYPETLEDVQDIILDARKKRVPVRFFAECHSWSSILNTDGYLVSTKNFDEILEINEDNCTVRVQAGVVIKDLARELAHHGLALSNQGCITAQTAVGAACTSTHGTGKTGTFSDFIKSIEIVNGMGSYQVISHEQNSEWLPALRTGLGAFGFIYAITFQCEPLFVLKHRREQISWDTMIKEYAHIYENNDYAMYMAHAFKDNGLLYIWNRVDQEPTYNFITHLPEKILLSRMTNFIGPYFVRALPRIANKFINGIWFKALQQREHYNLSYLSLSPIKNPYEIEQDYFESEIAVPFENFGEAVVKVRDLCREYHERDALVGFITCRFGPGYTMSLLSPTYGRKTAYINLTIVNSFPNYDELFQRFMVLMEPYEGRPHWGKFHYLTGKRVKELYGANYDEFNRVRRHFDPEGIFENSFIRELFG